MSPVRRTGVVIPCFNEAQRLKFDAYQTSLAALSWLEFIFVDDGSSDTTRLVLESFRMSAGPRVHVLHLDHNSGKAEAVRQGVQHAFDLGFELIGYWDADLATPLRYIAVFAELLEKPNTVLVVASRVRLLGRRVERSPLRHYVGRGFATLAALTLGLPIYDTQCGAKLFHARDVIREAFSRPFSLNWAFDVELLVRLLEQQACGAPIDVRNQCIEYPLEEWVDAPGSKLRPHHLPHILRELVTMLRMAQNRRTDPVRNRLGPFNLRRGEPPPKPKWLG
jgi:glycosyltransferase involved in cell wall biosynthesis